MNRISSLIKYNNWEKLEENQNNINEKNFLSSIIGSIHYRSKECFDILMNNPNCNKYINHLSYRSHKLFETYSYAPNNSNEYYLLKILPSIAYITSNTINMAIDNKKLFVIIFDKVQKTETFFQKLFEKTTRKNNLEVFTIGYNYLVTHKSELNWFNNNWIEDNIIYHILLNDACDILKFLDQQNVNIENTKFYGCPIPSLIISIYGSLRYENHHKFQKFESKCFEYLLSKNYSTTINMMWALLLSDMDYEFFRDDYQPTKENFKMNIDWEFDYSNIFKNQNNQLLDIEVIIDPNEINNMFNEANLIQKVNNINFDDRYNSDYLLSDAILFINYLIDISNKYPQVKQMINNLVNIANVNVNLIQNLYKTIYSTTSQITSNRSNYSRGRWRRSRNRFSQIKTKFNLLNYGINIMKYIYENKINNINPIDPVLYTISNVNKGILKKIIMYFINQKCVITDSFKKEIYPKIFTKIELKKLDNNIKLYKFEILQADLKSIYNSKVNKKAPVRKSKKNIIPGIGGENENIINPENIESDSDDYSSENNSQDELDV